MRCEVNLFLGCPLFLVLDLNALSSPALNLQVGDNYRHFMDYSFNIFISTYKENMRVKLFKEAGILSCHEWMAVKKHIDSVRI
jgi:hypothetical protein